MTGWLEVEGREGASACWSPGHPGGRSGHLASFPREWDQGHLTASDQTRRGLLPPWTRHRNKSIHWPGEGARKLVIYSGSRTAFPASHKPVIT